MRHRHDRIVLGIAPARIHDDPAPMPESRRWFDAPKEGGRVVMAFSPTFWSPGFGSLVDRFGVPWTVNTPLRAIARVGSRPLAIVDTPAAKAAGVHSMQK